jgi:hypothetical protein
MTYRRVAHPAVLDRAFVLLLLAVSCLAQEAVHDHSCTAGAAGIFATPEDGSALYGDFIS